jgi:Protein-L-isoaspartate(D-aspartate) O-methyltransferase (PCMT)
VHRRSGVYVDTPSDDLAFLYQDVVVALVPRRELNNGEPHLYARCLAALAISGGEWAVGSGTGYYTAILAHLVGPTGTVVAYEIDQDLAKGIERPGWATFKLFVLRPAHRMARPVGVATTVGFTPRAGAAASGGDFQQASSSPSRPGFCRPSG